MKYELENSEMPEPGWGFDVFAWYKRSEYMVLYRIYRMTGGRWDFFTWLSWIGDTYREMMR